MMNMHGRQMKWIASPERNQRVQKHTGIQSAGVGQCDARARWHMAGQGPRHACLDHII